MKDTPSMNVITRTRTIQKEEVLEIKDCPKCGGQIHVSDCGYSSFNPGNAACTGHCKTQWDLGFVNDRWDAVVAWNALRDRTENRLRIFRVVMPESSSFLVHVYDKQDVETAKELWEELEQYILQSKVIKKGS